MQSGFNGTRGTDLASQLGADEKLAAQAIKSMLEQLLIVLVKRQGGSVTIPVAEIDGTGQDMLSMSVDENTREFTFTVSKKN